MRTYFSELKNKVVIITGGSKGIGKEIALEFSKLGSKVVIIGRNAKDLEITKKELEYYGGGHSAVQMDVNNVSEVQKKIDGIYNQYGSIDILINNAGINIAKDAFDVTEDDWDKVLDTNLKATFFMCQAVGRKMKEKNGGRIINMASQMSFVGYVKRAAYGSSKGGVLQLTKALAVEWAKYNINVNAVAPTFVETNLTAKTLEDKDLKKDIYQRILFDELPKPSDIVGGVLYLSSNLSNFVTGETIKIDAGWTAI